MLAFLCGGMEFAPEHGREWRKDLGEWLLQNLNHQAYDPTQEARRILSAEELDGLDRWKQNDLVRFRRVMRHIINHDLDVMAHRADYVVCYWDRAAARGGGTQAELTAAYRKSLPIYLVSEIPVSEISGWVLGCADHVIFGFEKLKECLRSAYGSFPRQERFWDPTSPRQTFK